MIYDGVISIFLSFLFQRGVDHYLTPLPHRDHYWAMTLIFLPRNYTSSMALQYTGPPRWCNHVNVQQGEQKLPFLWIWWATELVCPTVGKYWSKIFISFFLFVSPEMNCWNFFCLLYIGRFHQARYGKGYSVTKGCSNRISKRTGRDKLRVFSFSRKRYTTKFTCCRLSAHFQ